MITEASKSFKIFNESKKKKTFSDNKPINKDMPNN
jgi:hypothetical protein